jgi:crotonobetainyl-CoA:carnitine CoA-transferase CaiB-like acyl-CoA transferase
VLRLVGHPDLADEEWFATGPGRYAHADVIDEAIAGWVARRSREEVLREAAAAGVTLAPVNSIPDLVADPHVRDREMVTELADDELGHVRMPNLLFRMSKTPGALRWAGPRLGSSTDDVLASELGVDAETLTRLRRRGVLT